MVLSSTFAFSIFLVGTTISSHISSKLSAIWEVLLEATINVLHLQLLQLLQERGKRALRRISCLLLGDGLVSLGVRSLLGYVQSVGRQQQAKLSAAQEATLQRDSDSKWKLPMPSAWRGARTSCSGLGPVRGWRRAQAVLPAPGLGGGLVWLRSGCC